MESLKSCFFIAGLLLNSLVMVNLQVTNDGEDAEKMDKPIGRYKRHGNKESDKFTRFSLFLQTGYKGRSGDYYDEMPERYKMLFETTIYLETILFGFVLLYGALHLPFWETLYNKWKMWAIQIQKEEEEEETEADDVDTQSD